MTKKQLLAYTTDAPSTLDNAFLVRCVEQRLLFLQQINGKATQAKAAKIERALPLLKSGLGLA